MISKANKIKYITSLKKERATVYNCHTPFQNRQQKILKILSFSPDCRD
jgi:hypothetical protein